VAVSSTSVAVEQAGGRVSRYSTGSAETTACDAGKVAPIRRKGTKLKRYRPQILLLFGAALTMGSIAWELTRMHPATSYLVEPWSMRGFETVHGSVTFTIGALLFVTGLLTAFEFSLKPLYSRLLAFLMALSAVGVAVIYGTDERTMGGGLIGWAFALLGGYIIKGIVSPFLPELTSTLRSAASLGIVVISAVVLNLLLLGTSRSAQPWVWVTIAALLALGLSTTGRHAELSANRMLIFAVVGGGLAVAVSAAASRMNLIAAQLEESGLAAQYKDTQITSGYFVALLGILLAFIGAVSLWAARRDVIINRLRAERQRAAAEASAAEIQAALELAQQHQREARAGQ